jgi:hypothetical protein
MIQHARRVLAVIPGYPDELGQDLSPLATIAAPLISLPHRILKFSPCRHTQLPRHLLHHPAAPSLRGSSLREATTGDPVTKIVSQCAGASRVRHDLSVLAIINVSVANC